MIISFKGERDHSYQDTNDSRLHDIAPNPDLKLQDDILYLNDVHNSMQSTDRNLAAVPDYPLWNNDYRNGCFWIQVRIDNNFSQTSKNLIIHSLKNLQSRSKVIKFNFIHNNPSNSKPYLHLRNVQRGCWSFMGRRSVESMSRDGQTIGLNEDQCMNSATIQHEMMHALGFGHEQARLDRDEYIKIVWNNVISTEYRQFDKISDSDSLGTPYDLDSIMHYQPHDWSNGKGPTIIPKNGKVVGNRKYASPIDILQIKLMYQCINGPRQWNSYRMKPCSTQCQCWKNRRGCQGKDSYCKGKLVCQSNVCEKPSFAPTSPSMGIVITRPTTPTPPSTTTTHQTKQLVKNRIPNKRYFIVSGVMFDIQAKSAPIYIQNLIFKGLGFENTVESVQVDIFTKTKSHLEWSSSSSLSSSRMTSFNLDNGNSGLWKWIGSTTLEDNGTDNPQLFPLDTFYKPIKINPYTKQAFYIQVKNCSDANTASSGCNKLRVWEGMSYTMDNIAYVEDPYVKMLEGCVLKGRFDNEWGNCRNGKGGKSFTFWGGFQYSV